VVLVSNATFSKLGKADKSRCDSVAPLECEHCVFLLFVL